jgi:hypothetical protein
MNKYEELVFINSKSVGYCISVVGSEKSYGAEIDKDKKELVLKQEEDINLTKYQFVLISDPKGSGIENVAYQINKKWVDATLVNSKKKKGLASPDYYQRPLERGFDLYVVDLDFNDKATKIRISYKNGIIEPIELKIIYVEADKDKYYQKVAAQKRSDLLAKMSVSCRTGDSLVNVFWQNASNNVKKVLFELFLGNKQLIMKNEMDSDTMFKSVQGLAYGTYYFRLSQFNENGELIVDTDLISFTLFKPNYSGRPTVGI